MIAIPDTSDPIAANLLVECAVFDIRNAFEGPLEPADDRFRGFMQMGDLIMPPQLSVQPIEAGVGLRSLACRAIKQAITNMDIYGQSEEIRLDERQLSRDLGVSRTPIREALSQLEQEGFVRSVPRRGIFIVRKTKREIIEMITVWCALESMAARLACETASDQDIVELRSIAAFKKNPQRNMDEYSQTNMMFHRTIIRMSGCGLMLEMIENLFIHMRAIRSVAMRQGDRTARSIVDHMNIVDALEARDANRVSRLVRDHTLGLAAHIEKYGDFLDRPDTEGESQRSGLR